MSTVFDVFWGFFGQSSRFEFIVPVSKFTLFNSSGPKVSSIGGGLLGRVSTGSFVGPLLLGPPSLGEIASFFIINSTGYGASLAGGGLIKGVSTDTLTRIPLPSSSILEACTSSYVLDSRASVA